MRRRPRTSALGAALVAATVALGAGCGDDRVDLTAQPEVGDEQRYRYEIDATIEQSVDGGPPEVTELTADIAVDQEILEVDADGALARVAVRRDGGAPREAEVRLDRSGLLSSVDLIEGRGVAAFGLDSLRLMVGSLTLPGEPVAPGAEWPIQPDGVSGEGRLERLGMIDGEPVAVVRASLTRPLDEQVASGTSTVELDGELRSRSTLAYDLADGMVRRSSSAADGSLDALIHPPAGTERAPVPGRITYRIEVTVTRL